MAQIRRCIRLNTFSDDNQNLHFTSPYTRELSRFSNQFSTSDASFITLFDDSSLPTVFFLTASIQAHTAKIPRTQAIWITGNQENSIFAGRFSISQLQGDTLAWAWIRYTPKVSGDIVVIIFDSLLFRICTFRNAANSARVIMYTGSESYRNQFPMTVRKIPAIRAPPSRHCSAATASGIAK